MIEVLFEINDLGKCGYVLIVWVDFLLWFRKLCCVLGGLLKIILFFGWD